jgi:hypothetical protein
LRSFETSPIEPAGTLAVKQVIKSSEENPIFRSKRGNPRANTPRVASGIVEISRNVLESCKGGRSADKFSPREGVHDNTQCILFKQIIYMC